MTQSDEEARSLRLFMGALHVEVRLRAPLSAKASGMWFNELHACAQSLLMRTQEVEGVVYVRGCGQGVRVANGQIVPPGVLPTMGRRLLLWIHRHEAVDRMRFWRRSDGKGYRIVVLGGGNG